MENRFLRLEEISINGWPAFQTIVYDGWLIRFAEGYTKRSNSVSPIYGSGLALDEKIAFCEAQYRSKGLPVIFKVTPFVQPPNLDDRLEELGYELVDRVYMKTAPLDGLPKPVHTDIILETEPTPFWLDAIAEMNGLTDAHKAVKQRMMQEQPLEKAFAVLLEDGKPAACGLAVKEGERVGIYDIVTASSARRRGFGEQLMLHLLHWAKREGATEGYLLVVCDNEAANRLYDKLGFRTDYEYWYRVKK